MGGDYALVASNGTPPAVVVPTNGNLGGKQPSGKGAALSPFLNRSDASRYSITSHAKASRQASRSFFDAACTSGAGEVWSSFGRVWGSL